MITFGIAFFVGHIIAAVVKKDFSLTPIFAIVSAGIVILGFVI